ncbi:MAG: NAD(P)-binding domain-containing protein, partial [Candidatus Deferrimicrobiota bacterium]
MEIAMIGLGKMGANMTTRLLGKGHRVVVFDLKEEAVRASVSGGATGARTLDEAVGKLSAPRAVWVMVPAGKPTDDTIAALADRLSPGDIVIDGGNSNYKDTMRRAAELKGKRLHFVDVGTSGGVWGLS